MRIFAIADPHLSRAQSKPMDVFGSNWRGHPEVFFERWAEVVSEDDLVLIPGDISWALKFEDAMPDLQDIAALPGKKLLLRGNHDYWWSSVSKLRRALPEGMQVLQYDAVEHSGVVVAGTRGWMCPGSPTFTVDDEKIYRRELERLRLSLKAAAELGGQRLIVMLHYPPTNFMLEPSGFTKLLLAAKPDVLVFGHLHGDDSSRRISELGDMDVQFVAADALKFTPKLIMEIADKQEDRSTA